MSNKTDLKSLLYEHVEYHQHTLEGIQDAEQIQQVYNHWSECVGVVTAFTPRYIKIELPSKSKGLPVSQYGEHEIFTGLWLCVSDYGSDIDRYYWCQNRVTAKLRELICRLTAEGPYLTHIIQI